MTAWTKSWHSHPRPLPKREGSDYLSNEDSWHGIPVQSIIDARYRDKLPCAADSNRHNESLKLATDLLIMLDGDKQQVQRIVEAQPWVKEIIDERDENVGQTVASAAECVAQKEKKYGPDLKPSKAMQEAIEGRLSLLLRNDKALYEDLENVTCQIDKYYAAPDGSKVRFGGRMAKPKEFMPMK